MRENGTINPHTCEIYGFMNRTGVGKGENAVIIDYQGNKPDIHPEAFVAPGAVVIGNVTICAQSSVWYNAVLRGDLNTIVIGKESNIQDGTVVHVDLGEGNNVVVGNKVTIGHNVTLHACVVEDGALVGMGAVVLNGAVVGRESMVGAGAMVKVGMEIPPRSLVLGVPAKVVRELSDEEVRHMYSNTAEYLSMMQGHTESVL